MSFRAGWCGLEHQFDSARTRKHFEETTNDKRLLIPSLSGCTVGALTGYPPQSRDIVG